MFEPKPITLSTDKITLLPLCEDHLEGFFLAGNQAEIWQWSQPYHCESREKAKLWIDLAIEKQKRGEQVPFVILDNASNQIVGSTRYTSIRREDKGIEIGFTFINPDFQRSYVNTHAKYLLLKHAFETLTAVRVEFKTHEQNEKSRNAIARLGGVFEGVLRNQRILFDGTLRNTAIFSIIQSEWTEVKRRLEGWL